MFSWLRKLYIILLLMFALTLYSDDLITITGTVTDAETGEPVENVNILLTGTPYGSASDKEGFFKIEDIPPGTYTITFSHINYIFSSYTHDFRPGVDEEFRVQLDQKPILMEEVEVVDTVRRIERSTRHFFTRDELLDAGHQTLGQFLNRNLSRVNIRENGADLHINLQLREPAGQDQSQQNPLVIIDNIRIGTEPDGLAQIIRPAEIETLEVIRPPESRLLYGNDAIYGAIVIRTVEGSGQATGTGLSVTRHFITLGLIGLVLFFMYN